MSILYFLVGYIFLLVCWLILNLFFYALSVATKKGFFYIPFALNTILNWIIEIYFIVYPFYFLWQIVSANWGTWWIVVLSFIIGVILIFFFIGFWRMIASLVFYPISAISMYFSEKASEKINNKEEDVDYDVVSPEGKVVENVQSMSKTDKKLATYFVIDYLVNLIYIPLHPQRYTMHGALDYIFTPAFFMLQMAVVFGIIIGIYNLIRYKKFAHGGFKVLLTNVFKLDIIVLVGMQILATLILIFIS